MTRGKSKGKAYRSERDRLIEYFTQAAMTLGRASQADIEVGDCDKGGQAAYSLYWYYKHELAYDLDPSSNRYSSLLDAYFGADIDEVFHPNPIEEKAARLVDGQLDSQFPQAEFQMNKAQRQAICKAFCYPISFIQGPPGTGKTETILHIIGLALARRWTVAVASPNSTAVENVQTKVERAARGMTAPIPREGDLSRSPDLSQLMASSMVKLGPSEVRKKAVAPVTGKKLDFKSGIHKFKDGARLNGWEEDKRFGEFTSEYPFVTSTVHSLKKCFADGDEQRYDLLIVDEASQLDVVAGIVALSCAKRIVFVGDTEQLPPVVAKEAMRELSAWAHDKDMFSETGLSPYDMGRPDWSFLSSCYEVFVARNPDLHTLLEEHFRCHPGIIGFSNREIYGNRLHLPDLDDKRENVPCPISILYYQGDYSESVWVKDDSKEEDGRRKRYHSTRANAKQIAIMREEEAPHFLELVREGCSICMLTPYKGQMYRLKNLLEWLLKDSGCKADVRIETVGAGEGADSDLNDGVGREAGENVETASKKELLALTIHKAQGQEYDVVYLFPVEDGNWEWPWSQGRRLVNVAVTRAIRELRIITSTKLMGYELQKRLVGKVAQVTNPAKEQDDKDNQHLFVRKLMDYVYEKTNGDAAGWDAALIERRRYGLHKSAVVSIFDEINDFQGSASGHSDSAPERCVEKALTQVEMLPNIAFKKHVRFDELEFCDGETLADKASNDYQDASKAHFDFVLFDKQTCRVVMAIEVDGPHHRFKKKDGRPDSDVRKRDCTKNLVVRDICRAAMARLIGVWTSPQEWYGGDETVLDKSQQRNSIEWVTRSKDIPNDASFVFLRIPTDGSTYCEIDGLAKHYASIPSVKKDSPNWSDKEHYPPITIDQLLRSQCSKIDKQGDDVCALYVRDCRSGI